MRIAFLTSADNVHINVKAKALLALGHEIYYFGIRPSNNIHIKYPNITKFTVGYERMGYFSRLAVIPQITKLVDKHSIDVLHIIGMGWAFYAPFVKSKVVLENNGSDVILLSKWNILKYMLFRISYKYCDAVVQDSLVAQSAGISIGAPLENNQVIELGVDFTYFNPRVRANEARKRLSIGIKDKMIFSPRGLTDLYNIDVIIESIPLVKQYFPDCRFVFCRHFGKLESEYQEIITKNAIENNVIFAGFLDNESDMPFYCKDADVVLSVPKSDSSPRSVYEALACKTRVIISELPWYHNKLLKDKHVKVLDSVDPQTLARGIIDIINDKSEIDVDSAFQRVYEHVNMIDAGKKLDKVYKTIIRNRSNL